MTPEKAPAGAMVIIMIRHKRTSETIKYKLADRLPAKAGGVKSNPRPEGTKL
jgi:hypothetical protein